MDLEPEELPTLKSKRPRHQVGARSSSEEEEEEEDVKSKRKKKKKKVRLPARNAKEVKLLPVAEQVGAMAHLVEVDEGAETVRFYGTLYDLPKAKAEIQKRAPGVQDPCLGAFLGGIFHRDFRFGKRGEIDPLAHRYGLCKGEPGHTATGACHRITKQWAKWWVSEANRKSLFR
jgi:hypothetical protein